VTADTTAADQTASTDDTSAPVDTSQVPIDVTTLPGQIDTTSTPPAPEDQSATPSTDETATTAPTDETPAPADTNTISPLPSVVTPTPVAVAAPATPAPATPAPATPAPVVVAPAPATPAPATPASTTPTKTSPFKPSGKKSFSAFANKFPIQNIKRYTVFPEPVRTRVQRVITTRLSSNTSKTVKKPLIAVVTKKPAPSTTTKIVAKPSAPSTQVITVGNYTFTAINSTVTLSPLPVVISEKTLVFTGCNTFSIPYVSVNHGAWKIFGSVSSTQRRCKVNNDHHYLQVFRDADGYHHNTGRNFFLTRRGSRTGHFSYGHRMMSPIFAKQSMGMRRLNPYSHGY
jgi:hypothetical protein